MTDKKTVDVEITSDNINNDITTINKYTDELLLQNKEVKKTGNWWFGALVAFWLSLFLPRTAWGELAAILGIVVSIWQIDSYRDKKNRIRGEIDGILYVIDVIIAKPITDPVQDIVIDLPSDPEEQREKLWDIETNTGVVLKMRDGKAYVRPYKK